MHHPETIKSSPSKHNPKHPDGPKSMEANETPDRISNLPDSLLCHILSFLPTAASVRTSALSSRWRYLYASTPTLHFSDTHFPNKSKEGFVRFVYRVLCTRKIETIKSFRLRCSRDQYDDDHINTWICSALSHNVEELKLDLGLYWSYSDLNFHNLFNCKTLVSLFLSVKGKVDVPHAVSLPSLKFLLVRTHLDDLEAAGRLFSGCSALEELRVFCPLQAEGILSISNPTLKGLHMELTAMELYEYELLIDAPNLERLMYIAHPAKRYVMKNLNSLVKSTICFKDCNPRKLDEPVHDLVTAISEVETLVLMGDHLLGLTQQCPRTFPKLTSLQLLCVSYGFSSLHFVLESCPNLEVFSLTNWADQEGNGDGFLKPVPSCLRSRLRQVELHNFCAEKCELNMVKYVLQHAEVLENMTIMLCNSYQAQSSILQKKLSVYPRASRTSTITVA